MAAAVADINIQIGIRPMTPRTANRHLFIVLADLFF